MIDIYLSVEGQSLSVRNRPEKIVAGSKGMLRMHFNFASDWDGMKAVADFGGDASPICDGVCMVPDSVTDDREIRFRVIGEKDGGRMLTETATIEQKVV